MGIDLEQMTKLSERLTNTPPRIVPDDELDRALHWLINNAKVIGAAKARLVKAERMVDIVEAIESKKSDASSDLKRKADARSSDRYFAAINEEADAAGEYETLRGLRTAADMKIECWRSEQANFRGLKV